MPKRRKEGSKFTTISVTWQDKTMMRRIAKFKKETKNGKLYESDAEVFAYLILWYSRNYKDMDNGTAHPTYPTIHQGTHQQD